MRLRASTTTAAAPTVMAAKTKKITASALIRSGSRGSRGRPSRRRRGGGRRGLRRRGGGRRGRGRLGRGLGVDGQELRALLGEVVEVVGEIGGGELVLRRHVDAVRRAGIRAEVAVAAQRHVDVEDG